MHTPAPANLAELSAAIDECTNLQRRYRLKKQLCAMAIVLFVVASFALPNLTAIPISQTINGIALACGLVLVALLIHLDGKYRTALLTQKILEVRQRERAHIDALKNDPNLRLIK